jgi:hypothetical protein
MIILLHHPALCDEPEVCRLAEFVVAMAPHLDHCTAFYKSPSMEQKLCFTKKVRSRKNKEFCIADWRDGRKKSGGWWDGNSDWEDWQSNGDWEGWECRECFFSKYCLNEQENTVRGLIRFIHNRFKHPTKCTRNFLASFRERSGLGKAGDLEAMPPKDTLHLFLKWLFQDVLSANEKMLFINAMEVWGEGKW